MPDTWTPDVPPQPITVRAMRFSSDEWRLSLSLSCGHTFDSRITYHPIKAVTERPFNIPAVGEACPCPMCGETPIVFPPFASERLG